MALSISDLWNPKVEDAALSRTLAGLHRDAMQAAVKGVTSVGVAADPTSPALTALFGQLASRVTGINQTTRDALAAVLADGQDRGYTAQQIADGVPADDYPGVSGVFDGARGYRAEMIAQTETAMAFNLSSTAAYRDGGIDQVEVSDGDGDPECSDADGQVWTLDEAEANPLEHPNCVRQFLPLSSGGEATQATLDEGD
jgi:hypothetical protein